MALDVDYERNVGGYDRLARAVLAVGLFGVGGWALLASETLVAAVALLSGTAFAFNAATQFCLANRLLGIDTCSWDGAEDSV